MADIVATPQPIMSIRRVSLFGALFIAIGPMSMTLYTPAMTNIVEAFGTSEAAVKLTMTFYFAGFAFAQLIAGPASDALGRKPVTFAFIGLFLVGTLLALVAPTIEMLIFARFLQGLGASAGIAISRALVRDVFDGDESSRIMNLIGIILALGPAFAPTIGGVLLTYLGWRSIFVFMLAFGILVIVLTATGLRETVSIDRSRFNLRTLLGSYRALLGNGYFMTTSMVMAGAIGAIYAQSTILPFVLMDRVGMSPSEFGLGMLLQSGGYFAGSLVVRAMIGRVGALMLVLPGLVIVALGSLGLLNLVFAPATYLQVMVPISVFSFGIAFIIPAMTTATLAPFPKMAGAAASLMGFMQMAAGLAVGSIAAAFGDPVMAVVALTIAMSAASCIAFVVYRLRYHTPMPAPRLVPIVRSPLDD